MRTLEKLTIKGFKSIREQTLELDRLNVVIGGNGVGKSNLIAAFKFLREIVDGRLGQYSLTKGASTLLHFGRKRTPEMFLRLEFGEGDTSNAYAVRLTGTDDNSLIVAGETAYYHERLKYREPFHHTVSSGGKESQLRHDRHISTRQVVPDLESYRVYHFHDTSDSAAVKDFCDVEDNRILRSQAENLAAFLYWMQLVKPEHFANIQDMVRQIAPFFEGFRLAPSKVNEGKIRLEWHDRSANPDENFNAHVLSDGTLRFICLATLLLQPTLPRLILLDEPELGLHPSAIGLLAELLRTTSAKTQILVSTQSVTLVNQLSPADIIVVDRVDGQSVFRRPDAEALKDWLEEYSMGELWEKNVLGGRP